MGPVARPAPSFTCSCELSLDDGDEVHRDRLVGIELQHAGFRIVCGWAAALPAHAISTRGVEGDDSAGHELTETDGRRHAIRRPHARREPGWRARHGAFEEPELDPEGNEPRCE